MEDVLGYSRGCWMPPPGNYSHRIAPVASRVIGIGTHNQGCGSGQWKWHLQASSKKAQNWPSTHVIDATSFVKLWHRTIGAEELSYFSQLSNVDSVQKLVNLLSTKEAFQKVDGHERP